MALRRRRWRGCVLLVLVGLALAAGAWLGRIQLLTFAGALLVEERPLARADLVAILGDPSIARAVTAGELVRDGHAPRVLVLVPRQDPEQALAKRLGIPLPPPDEVATLVLRRVGVPEQAIVREPTTATGTNAAVRDVARLAKKHGASRLIVVTYRSHSRRTAWLLRRALGSEATVVVRAAGGDRFRPDGWWRHRETAREFVTEALRWGNSLVLGDFWSARDEPRR